MAGLIDTVVVIDRRMSGAKGRHFDDLVTEAHMRKMKAPADQAAIAKQLPHLIRVRIRRDVEILRIHAEEQVAHRASDEERLIAGLSEPIQDFQGIRGDVGPRNGMFIARENSRAAIA
jgi:hypothetical protein